jgi:hypothetical protein
MPWATLKSAGAGARGELVLQSRGRAGDVKKACSHAWRPPRRRGSEPSAPRRERLHRPTAKIEKSEHPCPRGRVPRCWGSGAPQRVPALTAREGGNSQCARSAARAGRTDARFAKKSSGARSTRHPPAKCGRVCDFRGRAALCRGGGESARKKPNPRNFELAPRGHEGSAQPALPGQPRHGP